MNCSFQIMLNLKYYGTKSDKYRVKIAMQEALERSKRGIREQFILENQAGARQ